jgi:hypothetical protein
MRLIFKSIIIVLCFSYSYIHAADIDRKQLHKNPFLKPANFSLSSNVSDGDDAQVDRAELVLRATLVSGDANSIANINGEMLTIGQKINGFELVSVDIGTAVLIKNGKVKALMVNEKYKNIK